MDHFYVAWDSKTDETNDSLDTLSLAGPHNSEKSRLLAELLRKQGRNASVIYCTPLKIKDEMLDELVIVLGLLQKIEHETKYCTAVTQSDLTKLIKRARGY